MRRTDKKIEKNIRRALTDVCELALKNIDGFKWLTHHVNYDLFPDSLVVVCVFETNLQLHQVYDDKMDDYLSKLIAEKLLEIDIKLQDIQQQINFDTEQNCQEQNNGKWHERLR